MLFNALTVNAVHIFQNIITHFYLDYENLKPTIYWGLIKIYAYTFQATCFIIS